MVSFKKSLKIHIMINKFKMQSILFLTVYSMRRSAGENGAVKTAAKFFHGESALKSRVRLQWTKGHDPCETKTLSGGKGGQQ